MSTYSLTGNHVSDTYLKLLQIVNGEIYDGDGNLVIVSDSNLNNIYASYSILQNQIDNLGTPSQGLQGFQGSGITGSIGSQGPQGHMIDEIYDFIVINQSGYPYVDGVYVLDILLNGDINLVNGKPYYTKYNGNVNEFIAWGISDPNQWNIRNYFTGSPIDIYISEDDTPTPDLANFSGDYSSPNIIKMSGTVQDAFHALGNLNQINDDVKFAINLSNSPSESNPFATISDIPSYSTFLYLISGTIVGSLRYFGDVNDKPSYGGFIDNQDILLSWDGDKWIINASIFGDLYTSTDDVVLDEISNWDLVNGNLPNPSFEFFDISIQENLEQLSRTRSGRIIWIDSLLGSDDVGIPYRTNRPYRTISSALVRAIEGDTIHIRPGEYETFESIAIDGISWYLDVGVVITHRPDDNIHLFTDGGNQMSFKMYGKGILRSDPSSSYTNYLVHTSHSESDFYLECLDILNIGTSVGNFSSDIIHQEGGRLVVECRDISVMERGKGYPVWWSDGDMSIRCRNIIQSADKGSGSGACSMMSVDYPVGKVNIDCDLIENRISGFYTIEQGTTHDITDSTACVHINSPNIKGHVDVGSDCIYKQGGGNLYINSQKVSGFFTSTGNGGELYLDVMEFVGYDTSDKFDGVIKIGGSKSIIKIGKITTSNNGGSFIFISGAGSHYLKISDMNRPQDGTPIYIDMESGKVTLEGIIDCSTRKGFGIHVKNGNLSLMNTKILVDNSDSIGCDTPIRVSSLGSGSNYSPGGDVIISGSFTVDADLF